MRKQNMKKSDLATEAHWDFLEDPEQMGAVEWAARKASAVFDTYEYGDAHQDALLWLSVRPELQEKTSATGDYRSLGQTIYSNGLRAGAVVESDWQRNLTSLDGLEDCV